MTPASKTQATDGTQAFGFSRSGDHLGRRRFPCRQRSGQRVASRKRGRYLPHRRRPLRRIFLQTAQDRFFHDRINVLDHRRRRPGRRLQMRAPPLDRSGCLIRKASGEQLIKHEPQRVDIAANAGFALSNLLWSHVGRRTCSFAPASGIVAAEGQPEVRDAHPPSSIEHDVGGLQIAMQQSAIVRGGETSADLVRGLQSLVAGQAADAAQQRRKILAVDVLHGEKVLAVHLADVVDATDIRVRNLAGIPHFGMKAGQSRGIILE